MYVKKLRKYVNMQLCANNTLETLKRCKKYETPVLQKDHFVEVVRENFTFNTTNTDYSQKIE